MRTTLFKLFGFVGVTGFVEIPLVQERPSVYLAAVISIVGHVIIKCIDRWYDNRPSKKNQTP